MFDQKEYAHKYYLTHKEYFHQWHLDHKESELKGSRENRARLKLDVLTHYSSTNLPSCARCSIDDIDVLCIDHINGGGNKQKRELGVGVTITLHRWLKQQGYPEGYQVLCWNCNAKKSIKEDK